MATQSDYNVAQAYDLIDQLPTQAVAIETALGNTLDPVFKAVGKTHDSALNKRTNAVGQEVFSGEKKINAAVQKFVDWADQFRGPIVLLFGGKVIPFSGQLVGLVQDLATKAEAFDTSIKKHNPATVAAAKGYIEEFLAALKQVILSFPVVGSYVLVDDITVSQAIADIETLLTSV